MLPIFFDGKKITYPDTEKKVNLQLNNHDAHLSEKNKMPIVPVQTTAQKTVQDKDKTETPYVSSNDSDKIVASQTIAKSEPPVISKLEQQNVGPLSNITNNANKTQNNKIDVINNATVNTNKTKMNDNSGTANANVKPTNTKAPTSIWDALDAEILKETPVTEDSKVVNDNSWVIQVGVFSNITNAAKLVERLKNEKYKAFTKKQGDLVRVMVGPDVSKEKLIQQIDGVQNIAGVSGAKVIRVTPE